MGGPPVLRGPFVPLLFHHSLVQRTSMHDVMERWHVVAFHLRRVFMIVAWHPRSETFLRIAGAYDVITRPNLGAITSREDILLINRTFLIGCALSKLHI